MDTVQGLRIILLGPPRVETNGTVVTIRRRKVMALLAYIAVAEQPSTRDRLATLFYPRMNRDRAYAGIRQSLSYLKDAVGEKWLEAGPRDVALRSGGGISVDVRDFESLLKQARGAAAAEVLWKAVGFYRGGFLAGFYLRDCPSFENWQSGREQDLRSRCAEALARLAGLCEGRKDLEKAVAAARRLVDLDPLEEEPQRNLMRLLAEAGQSQAALRQYEGFRRALSDELEEEPDEETVELRDAIRTGKVKRAAAAEPARRGERTAPARSRKPPAGPVSFVYVEMPAATRSEEASRGLADAVRRLEEAGGAVLAHGPTEAQAAFSDAPSALAAALRAQLSARAGSTSAGMRMAVHAGEAEIVDGTYGRRAAERTAFLLRAAHEGQILVSGPAAERAGDQLPEGSSLRSLGTHRLEDLGPPLLIHRLGHPDLPARFPSIRTLESRAGNLQGQPTFLVGREKEMAGILETARTDGIRLITLTGPGGTGKTRLALHAAARLSGAFPHGAWFVDLAAVRKSSQVTPAIASTLGIREAPGATRPLAEMLKDFLRSKEILLILDNFEHVLDAAEEVARIAAFCPGVRILATSREPLHLRGEREVPVPPLQLPGDGPARGSGCESVRLFLERTRAVNPGLHVDGAVLDTIGAICKRLDGLPLAIELAAARTKVLTPAELLERLSSPMDVLQRGAADLPERQRTLRREVRWSYDLLTEDEKRIFLRLSVFPAGCLLEAVEAVCGPGTLDTLGALVDKSLLRRQEENGNTRYRMLHVIREFALEELKAGGGSKEAQERFALFETDLAERAARLLFGSRQVESFALLDAETDNLVAALAWMEEERRAETGVRLSGALGWFWFRRGRFTFGARWLERFLDLANGPAAAAAQARALYYLGWTRLMLGTTYFWNREALEAFRKCLPLWQAARDGKGEALTLAWLSWCEVDKEKPDRYALADRGVAAARATEDPWTISFCLKLANSYMVREDKSVADRITALEESISLARRTGDPFLICQALHGMGDVHMFLRDDHAAEPWYEESIALAREIGDSWSVFDAQSHLGWGYINRNDLVQATECFADALRSSAAAGARSYVGQFLTGFAIIAKRQGNPVRALRLGGAASALKAFGQDKSNDALVEDTGLPDAAVDREWNEGRAMGLEEAIRFALGEETPAR